MSSLLEEGKCMIVAELSANHNHDLDIARESLRAIAETGADAVKLQTYRPDSLTLDVRADDFQLKGGLWDGRWLYELYQEACTPYEWHAELYALARELGLVCFSTPFDSEGVDLLASLDNPIYKIASFEIMDIDLIRYAARQGRPMVISTGIGSAREIEEAVEACRKEGNDDITLLKCTSAYPARIEDGHLLLMRELREKYSVKVGLSDHSPGSMLPVLSVALGGVMIEKHFILDRSLGGPDAAFSMDKEEFAEMVAKVRRAEAALAPGSGIPEDEDPGRGGRQWSRSLYISEPVAAGEPFTRSNVACVRPGLSLHPRHLTALLGRRASKDYNPGDRIPESELGM
ncbi:MAG: pseudaminic acid synthase [Muribaculaceae bacterium]|nr:pseudaminic acid synthase [Muribaculaceae bacterium]